MSSNTQAILPGSRLGLIHSLEPICLLWRLEDGNDQLISKIRKLRLSCQVSCLVSHCNQILCTFTVLLRSVIMTKHK